MGLRMLGELIIWLLRCLDIRLWFEFDYCYWGLIRGWTRSEEHDDIGNSGVILAFWIRDNMLFRDSTVQHSIYYI
jgi:hypothetical protein